MISTNKIEDVFINYVYFTTLKNYFPDVAKDFVVTKILNCFQFANFSKLFRKIFLFYAIKIDDILFYSVNFTPSNDNL